MSSSDNERQQIVEHQQDHQDELNSIQTDLENVEEQMRPPVQAVYTSGRPSAGRAVFDSIRTALGSIRSRLSAVEEQPDRTVHDTQAVQRLSVRLGDAEMAHSARIPLGMLHRELNRRRESSSSSSSVAEISQKEEQSESGGPSSRSNRRSSMLLASRRLAEAAEGHQADMDLHGTIRRTSVLPSVREQTEEVKSEEMKKDHDKEEDIEQKERPILLTQSSLAKLDTARRSVLFSQSESLLSQTSAATVVYSWGTGVNSLHDDVEEKTVKQARVNRDSRVGRTDILFVSLGKNHAACSTSSGQVMVCGRNTSGAVDPDRKVEDIIARPTLLESLSSARIVQVSCGLDHTAALRSNGAVLTWGSNEFGQLGHRRQFDSGDVPPSLSLKSCRPAIMALGPGYRAAAVACGHGFTLVLTSRMGLLACGAESVSGYSKKQGAMHLPALIPALEDLPLVSVTAGRRHAVAVTAHGSAFAWGENSHGCLGREYPKASSVPLPVRISTSGTPPSGLMLPEPLSNWAYWEGGSGNLSLANDVAIVDAACGSDHTVLVTRSGRLVVCGSNSQGQLGFDPASKNTVYVVVAVCHPNATSGRSFVRAEAGDAHTLVVDDAGDVWQLVGGDSKSGPAIILEGKTIQWISAGGNQSVAVAAAPGRSLPDREFSNNESGDSGSVLAHSVEDLLRALPDDKKAKGNEEQPLGTAATELAARTEELLRTPAVLNSLFLDPTELEDLFGKLVSAGTPHFRQSIASAIEKGMQKGLDSIESDDARLMYPEQIRFLLLYVQCPLFVNWEDDVVFDHRGDLILSLCETILGLSYEGYRALLSWATAIYPGELFVRLLVRPLLAQLERSLSVSAGAQRRPIPAIVAVLRWLQNASERAGSVASPEDFYSEAVSNMEPDTLVEDLIRFKKANKHERAANFFLCDNPFLFSPTTKRNLLHIENEINMLTIASSTGLTYNAQERTFEFDPYYKLDVDREHLLPQTLQKIAKAEPSDLRKKLSVVFKGEDGVDAGGVTREFFQLISAQLFDVNTGMWSTKFEDLQITWFNSDCTWNDEGFYLVGILVGLAVYNGVLLDVHFPQAVYRKLLGLPLGLEDLVDHEVKSGLQQLLDYEGDDVEDIFCLTFDVNWMDFGQEKRRDLKPGGSDIPVTSDNKEEYVVLYVKWLLVDSIYPQYDAFVRGFMRVMESSSLELLRPEDLELLVEGSPELDFDALEKNTEYEGGYDSESDVIRNFWLFVKNASPETELKLLKFATGSSKAPIGGLGELQFKIQRAGPDSMQLPTSHTCFNTLLLPDYGDNFEKLDDRLGRAILECEGFGLQ